MLESLRSAHVLDHFELTIVCIDTIIWRLFYEIIKVYWKEYISKFSQNVLGSLMEIFEKYNKT